MVVFVLKFFNFNFEFFTFSCLNWFSLDRDETIKILIEHGAKPNIRNKEGQTLYDLYKESHGKIIQKYL